MNNEIRQNNEMKWVPRPIFQTSTETKNPIHKALTYFWAIFMHSKVEN